MSLWMLPALLWILGVLWAYKEFSDGDDEEFFVFTAAAPILFMLLTRFLP